MKPELFKKLDSPFEQITNDLATRGLRALISVRFSRKEPQTIRNEIMRLCYPLKRMDTSVCLSDPLNTIPSFGIPFEDIQEHRFEIIQRAALLILNSPQGCLKYYRYRTEDLKSFPKNEIFEKRFFDRMRFILNLLFNHQYGEPMQKKEPDLQRQEPSSSMAGTMENFRPPKRLRMENRARMNGFKMNSRLPLKHLNQISGLTPDSIKSMGS